MDGNDDGKVKVEISDDPPAPVPPQFSFHVNNLTDKSVSLQDSAPLCLRHGNSHRMKSPNEVRRYERCCGRHKCGLYDRCGRATTSTEWRARHCYVMAILNHAAGLELLETLLLADLNGDGTADEVDRRSLTSIPRGRLL